MDMANRMRLPLDQRRMQLVAKKIFEYRRWEGSGDDRKQSEVQSKTKSGVPLWEVTCVSLGEGPDRVKVIVQSEAKPDLESGDLVEFEKLDARVWHGKKGLGADYYAMGIKKVHAKQAA